MCGLSEGVGLIGGCGLLESVLCSGCKITGNRLVDLYSVIIGPCVCMCVRWVLVCVCVCVCV